MLVHRGIYEAAKGIYEQFLPKIMQHLNEHGDKAKLQFTGHSLGGSLSLLVNLMLLTRKVVNPTCLLPVVMFGAPFVFCGGEKVLEQLGLNENHVHSVMMHRDIVPRAFSCNYPNHVATILKRLNATFRSHPCLNKNVSMHAYILTVNVKNLKIYLSIYLTQAAMAGVSCRNCYTLQWEKPSSSNQMRSYHLLTHYSLLAVPCTHWKAAIVPQPRKL